MKIVARAPTRISLFGGGTDVDPFASTYGGKVLNMAINLRHECQLADSDKFKNFVKAMGDFRFFSKPPKRRLDPQFDLIYEIVRSYKEIPYFEFRDVFEGIQSAGLGSSAAAAVSMIGAFNLWLGIEQSKMEIANKAWEMEVKLGWVSGKQDQYASALGGVNFFEFDSKVWNEPMEKGVVEEFLPWCLLVYTGKTRHSADLQNKLKKRMLEGQAIEPLKKMRTLTWEGRDALKSKDFEKVGWLLDQSWRLKRQTNPASTNTGINGIYGRARKAGAIGGKVLGAGGEGHFLFISPPDKKEDILQKTGLREISFSVDYNGLEVRRVE